MTAVPIGVPAPGFIAAGTGSICAGDEQNDVVLDVLTPGLSASESNIALDTEFLCAVWLPIRVTWIIGRRAHPELCSLTNAEIIEELIGLKLLSDAGYADTARHVHRAIDIYGHNIVRDFFVANMKFV